MWEEVTWKDRPDLVVLRDAKGFELGGGKELNVLEDFLIQKWGEDNMMKRLYAVRYVPSSYYDSLANASPGFA